MVEKTPSISVNKLAEFMTAGPARQRQILKDRKYPTEFKGMYYKDAAESIAKVLASNLEDVGALTTQKLILEQTVTDKIGTQRRITANMDALARWRNRIVELLNNHVMMLPDQGVVIVIHLAGGANGEASAAISQADGPFAVVEPAPELPFDHPGQEQSPLE
jgi:hypothetical protein